MSLQLQTKRLEIKNIQIDEKNYKYFIINFTRYNRGKSERWKNMTEKIFSGLSPFAR